MKKKLLVLFIPLLLLLAHCQKNEANPWQTIVNGTAVEYNTTVPITNANVQLFAGASTQAEAITDDQGKFHFDFIATPGVVYTVLVRPDTINTRKKYFQTRLWHLIEGEINDLSYPVTPYAYVKMHLKNVNPVDPNDRISVNSPLRLAQSFGGSQVDTTFVDYSSSNEDTPILYWVYRNGVGVVHRKSQFLPAHDTTFIEILY
jgi:hypothetical protein